MVYNTFINLDFSVEDKIEVLTKLGYTISTKYEEIEVWKGFTKQYEYLSVSDANGRCLDGTWSKQDSYIVDRIFEIEFKKKLLSLMLGTL